GLAVALLAVSAGSSQPSTSPTTTTMAPSTTSAVPEVVAAAEDALQAWGEFAVTGRVVLLEGTFDPAGPQYQQLASEASGLQAEPLGPPPYQFILHSPKVLGEGDELVVRGSVTMSRLSEPDRHYSWDLVMRRREGRWLLWTVEESGGDAAAVTG
ncbi:MAG: hypothetical protein ACRDVM_02475, partial [Acidimicrobiia bacterium]